MITVSSSLSEPVPVFRVLDLGFTLWGQIAKYPTSEKLFKGVITIVQTDLKPSTECHKDCSPLEKADMGFYVSLSDGVGNRSRSLQGLGFRVQCLGFKV